MSDRLIFLIGIIFLLYPFIGVFSNWKNWFIFAIGVLFVLNILFNAKNDKNSEE